LTGSFLLCFCPFGTFIFIKQKRKCFVSLFKLFGGRRFDGSLTRRTQAPKPLVVMRQDIGHKNNGLTENKISADNSLFLNLDKQFFWFLLSSARFGFDKPVLAITNLAHLPLRLADADTKAKSKKLNLPTHFFGFFKPSFAITNLTQFVFARDRQKQNKLNFPTHKIGLLRSFYALLTPFSQRRKPQACGILFISASKTCLSSFSKNTLGFP